MVLITTVLARGVVDLIDRYAVSRADRINLTDQERGTNENREKSYDNVQDEKYETTKSDETEGTPESRPSDASAEESRLVDENSVADLETKVKALRAEATQLTSSDTFVQYARVTREANRLEKRVKELKGTSIKRRLYVGFSGFDKLTN